MNAKAARLARQVNRIAGTLGKKTIRRDAFEQAAAAINRALYFAPAITAIPPPIQQNPEPAGKPHKVKRAVKRWWAGLDHETRGKASAHWLGAVRSGALSA